MLWKCVCVFFSVHGEAGRAWLGWITDGVCCDARRSEGALEASVGADEARKLVLNKEMLVLVILTACGRPSQSQTQLEARECLARSASAVLLSIADGWSSTRAMCMCFAVCIVLYSVLCCTRIALHQGDPLVPHQRKGSVASGRVISCRGTGAHRAAIHSSQASRVSAI